MTLKQETYINNKEEIMLIEFDIDGTILTQGRPKRYGRCKSIPGAVEAINQLYELGHIIILHSARHWKNFDLTYKQLKEMGFKFHSLILGKINADIIVDDRAINNVKDLTINVFTKAVEKEQNRRARRRKKREVREIMTKILNVGK